MGYKYFKGNNVIATKKTLYRAVLASLMSTMETTELCVKSVQS